jgi:CRISPR system Cascade subunit CasB
LARRRRLVDHLNDLVTKGDLGALALLRRGLGRAPGDVPEIYAQVLPYLEIPVTPNRERRAREEDAALLVASLYAQWHQGKARPRAEERVSLGAAFRQLSRQADSGSIEGRFAAVLKSSRAGLPDHLRHAIALLRAKDIALDWKLLFRDVAWWDAPDQQAGDSTRRRWARDYWERTWESEAEAGAPAVEGADGDDGE